MGSTTRRCRPSLVLESTPRRAMRTSIPRRCRVGAAAREVVALVGMQFRGSALRPSPLPAAAADPRGRCPAGARTASWEWVLAAEISARSGRAVGVAEQVVLAAGLPTVFGVATGQLAPPSRPHRHRVDAAARPVQHLPLREAPRARPGAAGPTRRCPARPAAAARRCAGTRLPATGGQVWPAASGAQPEQDPPSSAARSSIRGRPPGPRGRGRGGSSGWISSQSRSSMSRWCGVTTEEDRRPDGQDHASTHRF